jgi:membrane protein
MTFWRQFQVWWRTSDSLLARWLRAAREALLGEMPVLAAGTALFAIIATVPALAAVVSIYGIASDPIEIKTHLKGLATVMPQEVVDFIGTQLTLQSQRSHSALGIQVAISIAIATFSARSSARALIDTLNRAYRVRELRSPVNKILISVGMALGTLVGLMVMFAIVVALPAIVAAAGLKGYHLVRILRWPLLLGLVLGTLGAMYRFAPSPRPLGTERHIWPGAGIATVLLVLVSWALSVWVDQVATYETFYGAFGSVIVIVLWFYFSTIALVVGGFINAELERHAGAPAPERSMY